MPPSAHSSPREAGRLRPGRCQGAELLYLSPRRAPGTPGPPGGSRVLSSWSGDRQTPRSNPLTSDPLTSAEREDVPEKFLETSMVVRMAPWGKRRGLGIQPDGRTDGWTRGEGSPETAGLSGPTLCTVHGSAPAPAGMGLGWRGRGVHGQRDAVRAVPGGRTHLQFPPGIELAQALHRLLAMHHGRHRGPLLKDRQTGRPMSPQAGSRPLALVPARTAMQASRPGAAQRIQ